ncbi:DUF4974 domain-containing protein [Pseudoflavitalea sp. G-6-1-2]|uniref:FecR family protein n=1 Tax=Pseudoflavitalea sp. G-6-1-2 TaxID=2728841 RepID=UPI00146B6BFA|nr:FecR family protein [Pseudoflavitalea sp. G-6-1-2]NML23560.1 DUF4974 domain-containing protein [Pseudoflavitalea sp. G-6-1-2]
MHQNQLEELLSKLSGTELSEPDRKTLMEYLADPANKSAVQEAISHIMAAKKAGPHLLPQQSSDEIIAAILAPETQEQQAVIRIIPSRKTNYRWWWVAASAIIIGAFSIWRIMAPATTTTTPDAPVIADRNPASNGAVLTLADGTTVLLDTLKDGTTNTSGGININIKDGHLVAGHNWSSSTEITRNTVSTPKGRQYMMVLSDGSKAWLNAGSSLEYPVVFTGNERAVKITGEVYFEIAAQPEAPFKVQTKNMEVQVLGTSFNVNAYDDETTINTTLVSGSVKVSAEGILPATLKPGQQARFRPSAPIKTIPSVDLDKILAWKNGYFSFDDLTLQQIMKLIERWYDVDVKYEGAIPTETYAGMVPRSMKLSGIIKSLKDMDVDARQEGRMLIISNKKQ